MFKYKHLKITHLTCYHLLKNVRQGNRPWQRKNRWQSQGVSGIALNWSFLFKDHFENEEFLPSLVYKTASSNTSFSFSSLSDLEAGMENTHAEMKSLGTCPSFFILIILFVFWLLKTPFSSKSISWYSYLLLKY